MAAVIPPKKNRKVQCPYDKHIHKVRHLVENTILKLKHWRGIATRYLKNASSFLAAVQLRCAMIWLGVK
jgi:transposase